MIDNRLMVHVNVAGVIMMVIQNYEPYAGSNLTLPCYTTLSTGVKWVFEPSGPIRSLSSTIYENGRIRKKFRSRFTIRKLFPGFYDLVINTVLFGDKGNYTCIENNGLGNKHIRILSVKGKSLYKTTIYVLNLN